MTSRRRRVLEDSYLIGQYNALFYDPPVVVTFFAQSMRYCAWPSSRGRLPYPDDTEEQALGLWIQKRTGHSLDIVAMKRLIDAFNQVSPLKSLSRARTASADETDKCHFAASRFLRYAERMGRLKPEHKAWRVNRIVHVVEAHREPGDPAKDYAVETLLAFAWHVKQHYLPERSFYAKK